MSDSTQNFTVGWQFTVRSPVTATELGYYDPNPKGKLKSNHDVGIFASDGSILLSTTITAGKHTTEDDFAFADVPSFILADGTYVIGGDSFDSDVLLRLSRRSLRSRLAKLVFSLLVRCLLFRRKTSGA
ncbi:MAG TPA: hypothetical protein VGN39_18435, partial [Terriglobales bacterium]|nr:hypothetical protein [Terriglobales bacterium]